MVATFPGAPVMVKAMVPTVPPVEPVTQNPLMPAWPAVIVHPLGEPAVTLSIVKLLLLLTVNSNAPILVPEIPMEAVPCSPWFILPGAPIPAEPELASTPRGANNVTRAIDKKTMIDFFKIPIIFP